MRVRFFWIILMVLTIVTAGALSLHGLFVRQEEMKFLRRQVRAAATSLVDSTLSGVRVPQVRRMEKLIADELGPSVLKKFVIIRNDKGDVIAQSDEVEILKLPHISQDQQWVELVKDENFILILNLKLPQVTDRNIQVGVAVEKSLVDEPWFSPSSALLVGIIFFLGLLSAWFLASALVSPISRFSRFISEISVDSATNLPALPKDLASLKDKASPKDEFRQLFEAFSRLVEKVNTGYKLSRIWSYQMAHELKTPLAIMEGAISSARRKGKIDDETAGLLLKELMHTSSTVTAFLSWAELEGASSQKNLFAVSVAKVATDLERRLAGRFPGRLQVEAGRDFYVFANLAYFEHVLMNLIVNSLEYSKGPVMVRLEERALVVEDEGTGVPSHVMQRLGEPFNRGEGGDKTKGHGLGLAYVQSVCRLYGWQFLVESTGKGSSFHLRFPAENGESKDEELATPSPQLS